MFRSILGLPVRAALAAGILAASTPASAALVYAIDSDNNLSSFDSEGPVDTLTGSFVTGLAQNESLIGIDFRLANGQLYGLGSLSNLYTIDTTTGAATLVGGGIGLQLSGTSFGFDVNPRADLMRVVSNTDQNLRVNLDTGALVNAQPNLAYAVGDPNFGANPSIVGSAYTNNFVGGVGTTLFGLDSVLDVLVTQNATTGELTTIGSLGVNATNLTGFDIFGFNVPGFENLAYAALQTGDAGVSEFYSIDLTTGTATLVGTIGGGSFIRDIAIVPIPEPSSLALLAFGMAGLARFGHRRVR